MHAVWIKGERPMLADPIDKVHVNLVESCWDQNPNKRPTFEEIVEELRTNKEIIKYINEQLERKASTVDLNRIYTSEINQDSFYEVIKSFEKKDDDE